MVSLPSSPNHPSLPPSVFEDEDGPFGPLIDPTGHEKAEMAMWKVHECSQVELPPDVLHDSDFESDATIPDVQETSALHQHCRCRLKCFTKFETDDDLAYIAEFRQNLNALGLRERNQEAFKYVRDIVVGPDFKVLAPGTTQYVFNKRPVCRQYWAFLTTISTRKISEVRRQLRDGHDMAPLVKERRMPTAADRVQMHKADAWCFWLYSSPLCEPLAKPCVEGEKHDESQSDWWSEGVVCKDHPLFEVNAGIGSHKVAARWCDHMNFEDIWHLYKGQPSTEAKVGRTTLLKCFTSRWFNHGIIKIRGVSEHAHCTICVTIKARRRKAKTEAAKQEADDEMTEHIDFVMAIRALHMRGNELSREVAKAPLMRPLHDQLIKYLIDGMDQAAFKCPRNVAQSKEFHDIWRPQLHVIGTIAHGFFECFFILDADIPKDANTNLTLMCKTFDLVEKELKDKGGDMPMTMILAADNTTRETKNQHNLTFNMVNVNKGLYDAVQNDFPPVGHSHNEQDQRFSVAGGALSKEKELETPEDFKVTSLTRAHLVGLTFRV